MSWLNPFRRTSERPPSPPSIRIIRLQDSPDDWRAGDLALCTIDGPWVNVFSRDPATGPETGRIYEVARVTISYGSQCLGFAEFGENEYLAAHFRKVRPDESKACTSEFLKLLKRQPEKVRA